MLIFSGVLLFLAFVILFIYADDKGLKIKSLEDKIRVKDSDLDYAFERLVTCENKINNLIKGLNVQDLDELVNVYIDYDYDGNLRINGHRATPEKIELLKLQAELDACCKKGKK